MAKTAKHGYYFVNISVNIIHLLDLSIKNPVIYGKKLYKPGEN